MTHPTDDQDCKIQNTRLGRRAVLKSLAWTAGGTALVSSMPAALSNAWATSAVKSKAIYATANGALDVSALPKLNDMQLGHLRHVLNLAAQPDGDWSHMMHRDAGQAGLDSYRYQLGHFHYALGLTHYHHLPAAPGLFRQPMDRFIQKMLRPEVWDYWRETSMSNPRFDPGLKEPRAPWTDPVAKENIMYSGHLHAMAGMYGVLFDDAKYEQPKSIVFTRSTAWDKPEVYEYDLNSLNDVIYWQMAESGYLGIPCEPNIVFITCNQLPILGFRFHDIRKGTAVADEVTKNYAAAWAKKGVMTEGGKFITALMMRQGQIIPGDPAVTASEGLSMNAWNRELVRKLFPDAVYFGLRKLPDGTMVPFPKSVLSKVLAAKAKGEPVDQIEDRSFQWGMMPDYAFYTTFLSEIGDRKTLDAMVAHANRHMNPTWEKDGLYYPRNDRSYDENGNLVFMDPLSGNAGIAYAQLNVQDGMWMLYNKPWSKEHFADLALTQVPHTVDVLRASYVREKGALVLTLRGRGGQRAAADLTVGNVPAGKSWTLYRDGELMASSAGKSRDALSVTAVDGSLSIRGQIERETDFVLLLA